MGSLSDHIRSNLYPNTDKSINDRLISYFSQTFVDAGTIDGTVTGLQFITISLTGLVGGRLYWLAIVGQGAPTTQPTLRAIQAFSNAAVIAAVASSWSNKNCMRQDSVTGALPDPAVPVAINGGGPWAHLRLV